MSKKGVSPLIATVLLVMIVVSIGAAVMLVIRGITGENIEKINAKSAEIACGSDVNLAVLSIGNKYQICKGGDGLADANITVILQNKGIIDVDSFKFTVIGPEGIVDVVSNNSISKDDTKQLVFLYDGTDSGALRQVRIVPTIAGTPGRESVTCIDMALTWEASQISSCPLS